MAGDFAGQHKSLEGHRAGGDTGAATATSQLLKQASLRLREDLYPVYQPEQLENPPHTGADCREAGRAFQGFK